MNELLPITEGRPPGSGGSLPLPYLPLPINLITPTDSTGSVEF
jgi:hypothetical protein